MLLALKKSLIFILHFCLQMTNLGIWGVLIFVFGLIRFALPFKPIQNSLLSLMHWCYFSFSVISVGFIKLFNKVKFTINIDQTLSKQKWYLIMANHISYLDIIILINLCAKHTSAPKFFLKQELIWLPFVGLAAWAMDMPFMRRYSREYIEKHPHKKGKDIETTRQSCQKFIDRPTSVINFVEGTRFTEQKAQKRKSPFSHLLRPKAGGIAFTLASMGEQFSNLLDVTICYSKAKRPLLNMLNGTMTEIIIDVKVLPMSDSLVGNYFEDEQFKMSFQQWLNQLWVDKNELIKLWMKN